MFAWVAERYGSFQEVLVWREIETPQPGPGTALVKIRATSVSFALILRIAGKYQIKDALPFVPGSDFVGEVVAVGAGSPYRVGERIMGSLPGGAFGEYALTEADDTFSAPEEMPDADAAAYLNSYQTSYVGLTDLAGLKAGEVLLVHGAAGGVGLAAIQIAKLLGATVIATAGSAEKLEICRSHGADHAINYRQEDFVQRVTEITKGHGADVIFDPVGGDVFDQSRKCIAFKGRLVEVGFAGGRISEIAVNRILLRTFFVAGFNLNAYRRHQPERLRQLQDELLRLYSAGKLRPVISQELPLSQLKQALQLVEERQAIGKIVLLPG